MKLGVPSRTVDRSIGWLCFSPFIFGLFMRRQSRLTRPVSTVEYSQPPICVTTQTWRWSPRFVWSTHCFVHFEPERLSGPRTPFLLHVYYLRVLLRNVVLFHLITAGIISDTSLTPTGSVLSCVSLNELEMGVIVNFIAFIDAYHVLANRKTN